MSKKTLSEIFDIFEEIKTGKGVKGKTAIIKANSKNEDFSRVLHFIANDMEKTGLSSKKVTKKFKEEITDFYVIEDIYDMISFLKHNNTGTNTVIASIQDFMKRNPDFEEFIRLVACKDYKLGVGKTELNDIYGHGEDFGRRLHADGWLFDWNILLAKSFSKEADKANVRMDNGEFIVVTDKLDGYRVTAVVYDNGDIEVYKRSGHILDISLYPHILKELSQLPVGHVYDGELICRPSEKFKDNVERYNYSKSLISDEKADKSELSMYVFDYLPLFEFNAGVSYKGAYDRKVDFYNILVTAQQNAGVRFDAVVHLPVLYYGNDFSMIKKFLDKAIANGEEGVMINFANGLYITGRSSELLKVKKVFGADVKCIAVYEGDKNKGNAGTLGGITVVYKGNETNVGAGFKTTKSDKWEDNLIRDCIWETPDCIVGKIVEIQFTEEQTNKTNGLVSPRFARIKCVRDDKTEESYEI